MPQRSLAVCAARVGAFSDGQIGARLLTARWAATAALAVSLHFAVCLVATVYAQDYALFFNNAYVDQADEATKLRDSMTSLGVTVNTFTGISQADFSAALAGAQGLVIPEMQNGSLYPDLDAGTRTLLTNYVRDGGLMVVTAKQDYAAVLINGLFGTSVTGTSGGASTRNAAEAAGTVFASGPATLSGANAVVGFATASLPASAHSAYENGTGGTTVMLLPEDAGDVVFLGFDWFQTPTPDDWATILSLALVANATDYASWGCTPNTVALGTYLNSVSQGATGDLEDLLDALDAVAEGDRCRSLAQLNGAIYGSLAEVGLQNSTLYVQTLARRLRTGLTDGDGLMAGGPPAGSPVVVAGPDLDQPIIVRGQGCCCPRWATWATGFGLGGSAQSDGNAPGLDYSLGGVLFGAESMVGGRLLGFYGGYLGNYVQTDVADSAKINGAAFGSYLVRHDGRNYYIVIGGLEFDDYDSTRYVQFNGVTAEGDFDGWKGLAYVERGLTLGGPCLRLQPLAALQYIYLRENRFSEHGAGAADLDVAGIDAHSLRSALGARVHGRNWARRGRGISPELRAMWIHEFLQTDTALNARFNPVGGAMFAVDGLDLGRDWVLAGGGLNWQLGGGWEAYADYDAFVNGQQTMHVGSGGISHVW